MNRTMNKTMKAIKFEVSFGVVTGFESSHTPEAVALGLVISAWKQAALNVFKETGIFVSAQFIAAIVVYPVGPSIVSETVVSVSGISNPKFQASDSYESSVRFVCEEVKKSLHQKTATLLLSEVETNRI